MPTSDFKIAIVGAGTIFREHMEHLSLETEAFARRLMVRHEDVEELNVRLERLLEICDASMREAELKTCTEQQLPREALVDMVHGGAL